MAAVSLSHETLNGVLVMTFAIYLFVTSTIHTHAIFRPYSQVQVHLDEPVISEKETYWNNHRFSWMSLLPLNL